MCDFVRAVRLLGLALTAGLFLLTGCAPRGNGVVSPSMPGAQYLPNTRQQLTPLAPPGAQFEAMNPGLADQPDWQVGHAVTTVVSPDKKTMLVLTSGYNRVYRTDGGAPDAYGTQFNWPDSNEYVFIYDISTPTPIRQAVVQIPNAYNGIVFDPSGTTFYVSGCGDDNVHIVTQNADKTWPAIAQNSGAYATTLDLGHPYDPQDPNKMRRGNGLLYNSASPPPGSITAVNAQVAVKPCAAGIAISSDGQTLVVANYYNDSISVFRGGLGHWTRVQPDADTPDFDLRPGKSGGTPGTPGGEYPFWVAIKGNGTSAKAYVSSLRDREIVVVGLRDMPAILTRIPTKGQPNKMTLNKAQTRLYVAADQTDTVEVIDTAADKIVATIPVIAPSSLLPGALAQYKGANTNSVTLSPDERQLYVTNGNLNNVAVVELGPEPGPEPGDADRSAQVVGLIPTGWYPNSVSFSGDGATVFVVNGKSPTGPNPDFCYAYGPPPPGYPNCVGAQEYNPQLTKAGLQSFARPNPLQLALLSAQVAANNRFAYTESAADAAVMAAVREHVKHVIFIIKENRTYDQVLGDLEIGNGDAALAEFGDTPARPMTPNLHNLARTFVTLDNFFATSEVSYDGWLWTTSAFAPDVVERQSPVAYAGRALSLDSEGYNRNVNVALPNEGYPGVSRQDANALTPDDPDLLPGHTDVDAPDGPDNEINTGYLWDSALRAGLSVRNYGFMLDTTRYQLLQSDPNAIPLVAMPALTTPPTVVAYAANVALAPYTDQYFRGFDNNFPDYYRFKEWEREFDTKYAPPGGEELPALSLVRFMHDHTGNFGTAILGVNTPETMQADNDYAVGLLVEKIAKSRYKDDTLIFVIEDDAQDGGDHVDSHRTVAFVAGATVKQGALVSTQYNTVDFLRTIEEVLGLPPLNLNDALARPMADVFVSEPRAWSFTATPSPYLYSTELASQLPPKPEGMVVPQPTHDAEYWEQASAGMDFTVEDNFDFATYNRILWQGLMGDRPYPD